jgi:hypothetical protein
VRIEVADDGIGIPQQDRRRVFEPYFSTKDRGTGLGLAIVSRIVADHHGYIRVQANEPRGARFVVELPGRGSTPIATPCPARTSRREHSLSRILVVDDEDGIRRSLAGILSDEGFDTTPARDGEEALASIASDGLPDLVLLDIAMPGRDGVEILVELRERWPALPV